MNCYVYQPICLLMILYIKAWTLYALFFFHIAFTFQVPYLHLFHFNDSLKAFISRFPFLPSVTILIKQHWQDGYNGWTMD